jgi:hypothetical protein
MLKPRNTFDVRTALALRNAFAALSVAVLPAVAGAQRIGIRVDLAPPPVYYPPAYVPVAPPVVAASPVPLLAPAQLDALTGPIALYPDPLLAQVLAASTAPVDVVSANQWVHGFPSVTEDQINAQPWSSAVKVLVHYPTVLQYLADHMAWTQQLGSAFAYQPGDVMASVQRLRFAAQGAGTLYPTPQQQVVVDAGAIRILPPTPDAVYVPVYDPSLVYVRGSVLAPISFSAGLAIGNWLDLDFDWGGGGLFTGAHWNDAHVIRDHVFLRPGFAGPRWIPDARRVVAAPHAEPGRGREPEPRDEHRGFNPGVRGDQVDRDERRGRDSMDHGR